MVGVGWRRLEKAGEGEERRGKVGEGVGDGGRL